MPYTLMKGLVWVLLAVLLGIVIGWLLRSVAAKRQVERARAAHLGAGDRDELDLLRQRVAELEPAAAERDRLRAELDGAGRDETSPTAVQPVVSQPVVSQPSPSDPVDPVETVDHVPADPPPIAAAPEPVPPDAPPAAPDLAAAAATIGSRVVADDLTVVEGIGPKIADLCHGIGIRTWADLAETEVSLLRTMLNDAGQRFKAHDPGTWPQQAALLAQGAWDEFVALTDRLDGGRPVG